MGLRRFLKEGAAAGLSCEVIMRRLRARNPNFLALMKRAVFDNPASSYAPLLRTAGCECGDSESSVPNAQFSALDLDMELLPIDDSGLIRMFEEVGCVPAVIPEGSYASVASDVPTVAALQYLAVRAETPDDIIYQAVNAVCDGSDILLAAHAELRLRFSAKGGGAALVTAQRNGESFHPRALEFYRDMGWGD